MDNIKNRRKKGEGRNLFEKINGKFESAKQDPIIADLK